LQDEMGMGEDEETETDTETDSQLENIAKRLRAIYS